MRLPFPLGWLKRPPPEPAPVNPPGEAERLLRRLDFTVVRRLDGLLQGEHVNAAYGSGLDLAELREYQPGDDVRSFDWNVTARMNTPYVRRFHEDRDVTAWLVLDLTGSTDFGSGQQTKQELAIDLAGTLSRLLSARGDRVGALLYTGSASRPAVTRRTGLAAWATSGVSYQENRLPAERVAAGGGRPHTLRLLQRALAAANRARPSAHQEIGRRPANVTDLANLLEQVFHTATRRSLVFLLSDFLDASDDESDAALALTPAGTLSGAVPPLKRRAWERALSPLARRHEVIGIWLRDPREITLPDVGVVTFQDAETGQQFVADTSQPGLRTAFQTLAEQRAKRMERAFSRLGAALWPISTAEPLVPALVHFLEQRRRTLVGAQRLAGQLA